MPYPEIIAALSVGFLGSVHCIGMCGGIVSALTFGLPDQKRRSWIVLLPYLVLYNAGRLASYAFIGGLFGWLGQLASDSFTSSVSGWGGIISSLFLVLLGLYIAGWLQAMAGFERLGGVVWRSLEPLGRKLLPVRSPLHALGLGLVWGWLPCGMVYATLPLAVTTGSVADGALIMLAFGIGTLPMLILMGTLAEKLRQFTRQHLVRQIAGLLIIAMGIYGITSPGAHHHQHGADTLDATGMHHH